MNPQVQKVYIYKCEKCEREILGKRNYQRHLQTHEEDPNKRRPYKCDICKDTFTREDSLKSHLKLCHENDSELTLCEKCGKTFNSVRNLNRHLLTHANERPYKCSTCQKTFSMWSYLKTHSKCHEVDRALDLCEKCGRTFKSYDYLKHHDLNFHVDE